MIVNLQRNGDGFAFDVTSAEGHKMEIDTTVANGGEGKGFSPMLLLLVAVGGCSAIDMVHILKKQRQNIVSFSVEVDGEREKVEEYSVWKVITIHYKLRGNIDLEKAMRAAKLSHEKYCSVSKALEHSSQINFRVSVESPV